MIRHEYSKFINTMWIILWSNFPFKYFNLLLKKKAAAQNDNDWWNNRQSISTSLNKHVQIRSYVRLSIFSWMLSVATAVKVTIYIWVKQVSGSHSQTAESSVADVTLPDLIFIWNNIWINHHLKIHFNCYQKLNLDVNMLLQCYILYTSK